MGMCLQELNCATTTITPCTYNTYLDFVHNSPLDCWFMIDDLILMVSQKVKFLTETTEITENLLILFLITS